MPAANEHRGQVVECCMGIKQEVMGSNPGQITPKTMKSLANSSLLGTEGFDCPIIPGKTNFTSWGTS